MCGLHCPLLLIGIGIVMFSPNLVFGSFYIDQSDYENTLFPPYVYILNGASSRSAIPLFFLASQDVEADEVTTVFNPQTKLNTIGEAINASALKPITSSSILQPTFTSLFTDNRLVQQPIPRISNISIEFAPILNPFEVERVTQADIGPFVQLNMNEQQVDQMPSFSIPPSLEDGLYLIQLSVYFPDQGVNAYYTSSLCLGDCMQAALVSWYAAQGKNPPSNNTLGSEGLSSNEAILNLTTVN